MRELGLESRRHVSSFRLPTAPTLADIVRQRAEAQTEHSALAFLRDGEHLDTSLTYGELDRRARANAANLQAMCASRERVMQL